MVTTLKQGLIDAQIKSYEDLLIPTNKIHTNILKGGKTDARLISQEVLKECNYQEVERYVAEILTEEFNHDIQQLNLHVVS